MAPVDLGPTPRDAEYETARARPFRFKRKRGGEYRGEEDVQNGDFGHVQSCKKRRSEEDSRHHRHRHSRSKRPEAQLPKFSEDDPTSYDDAYLPNARSSIYMDPDSAFRESLFDALADDEGAAFWEGVYGQPIHTYSPMKGGPEGELERMTDEEYAAHVRAKMYEKTHQHIIEERERREQERRAREEARGETRKLEREKERVEKVVEESSKRGEQRRLKARWTVRWESYLQAWDRLNTVLSPDFNGNHTHDECDTDDVNQRGQGAPKRKSSVRELIPWPVESGNVSDLNKGSIELFFQLAATKASARSNHSSSTDLATILKVERVRWHPDKVRHRLAKYHGSTIDIDSATMGAITEVFQVVDVMWSLEKARRTDD